MHKIEFNIISRFLCFFGGVSFTFFVFLPFSIFLDGKNGRSRRLTNPIIIHTLFWSVTSFHDII